MNTSILAIVLASALLTPSWYSDYGQAQQQSAQQKKPLVVLFGAGTNGWTKVVRAESPSAEVKKILANDYVCVFVDTDSPAGKKLAQTFDVTAATGMVISDRAGTTQAFWHQGDMTNANVAHYLQKYADPKVVVEGTETTNPVRTSYYPPATQSAPRSLFSSGSC
jgi:hypothetical protein